MLRIFIVLVFLLLPVISSGASFPVKFVAEFPVAKPLRLTAHEEGKLLVTTGEGTVALVGVDGTFIKNLQEKDLNGDVILKKPKGVAFSGGIIYVTDASRDLVALFTADGTFVESFGEGGSDPKEFSKPAGIFIDRGVIYIADLGNDRVQVFGPNGVFLRSIGEDGEDDARLKSPADVAVDPFGMIYVVDGDSRMVKVYRPSGDYLGKLPGLTNPGALAMSDDGVFVSDLENGSIVKFNFNRERLFSFGSTGKGRVQFEEIGGICSDRSGNIYAADSEKGTIQIIATERGQSVELTDRASPPTSVRWRRDLKLLSRQVYSDGITGRLYTIDDDTNAVHVMNGDSTELTLRLPDWEPSAVTLDRQGGIWIADRAESRLYRFDPKGKLLLTVGASGSRPGYMDKPGDVAISRDGVVYVADTGNDRVQVFDMEGVFHQFVGKEGVGASELKSPIAIDLDEKNNLYVLSRRYRMAFCVSPEGHFLRRFGDVPYGRGKLDDPVDLVVAGNEVFILDAGSNSVKVFGLNGEFVREFGAKGEGKGDFYKPASLTMMDSTHLIVSDHGNKRLQILEMVYTPRPPRELNGVAGMRSVELKWKGGTLEPYVESYRIYRAKGKPEGYREIATSITRSYRDTDVLPNVPYHYRIGAIARDGNETVSSESVKVMPARYKASAPLNLQAEAQEWSVDLQWDANREGFVDHYNIYRQEDEEEALPELVAETKSTSYSEGGLEPETVYTYSVAAVSTDGVESERTPVDVETLVASRPPLEIDIVRMSDIFSNTYKLYENEGVGSIMIANNTRKQITSLKLSFAIKEFMDFPTELEIRDLGPQERREVQIKAVFNNKILEVTEDTPVQTAITVSYFENQKPRVYSRNHAVNLYEKHRMLWVEKDRIATFITSKDPVLLEFTRSVVTQYSDIASPLVYAGALFEMLGQIGMTYLQHPNNPYQIVTGKTEVVDFVQYPRETLKHNSGVCTDLVVLYSAALESLGVKTLILGTPGHLFMMFSMGAVSEVGDDTMNGMLVMHEGEMWAPVELTLVGSSFMKAWEQGSKAYQEAKAQGIEVTDPRKAWARFKPASLPLNDWRVHVPMRNEVDKRYGNEVIKLDRINLKYASSAYLRAIKQNPKDVRAYIQLGIIYGEVGELDESLRFFERADAISPDNAMVKNNIANLRFLKGHYREAQAAYEVAAELDPDDPYILVNLAICYQRLKMKDKAAAVFKKAYGINSEVAQRYRGMALELLGSI